MASSIQLLRSTNPQERPFAGNLLEGQPAANLHSSEPGLFFKTTDGSVVKFGPAAITSDGSPPNSTPQGSAGNSVGELWLDKSVDPAVLKVYDGAQWVDAGSGGGGGGTGAFVRWIYTAIGGETSLSGTSGGVLLDYTPGLEEVYINGVLITRGVDYSATNGSSITNLVALTAGDVVTVLSMNPIETVQLPGQVTLLRWTILATAGQTVLSGIDSSAQQLTYTAGFEEVYVNGAFLRRGVDYTATNGSTITISSPLTEDDEVTVMAWSAIEIGSISVDQIPYQHSTSGPSFVRTVGERLRETISVKDFGAVGDGFNDDQPAIQAASTYAQNSSNHVTILFPEGTYRINDRFFAGRGMTLEGEGKGAVIAAGNPNGQTLVRVNGTTGVWDLNIRNLTFDGSITYTTDPYVLRSNAKGVTAINAAEGTIRDVVIENCLFKNLMASAIAFNCNYPSRNIVIRNNRFENGSPFSQTIRLESLVGFTEADRLRDCQVVGNTIYKTGFSYDGGSNDGIIINRARDVVVANNTVDFVDGVGIRVEESVNVTVSGNVVTESGATGITFYKQCFGGSVSGNVITKWGRIPPIDCIRLYAGQYVYAKEFPLPGTQPYPVGSAPLPANPLLSTWFGVWPYDTSGVDLSNVPAYSDTDYYDSGNLTGILPFRGYAAISTHFGSTMISIIGNTCIGSDELVGGKPTHASSFGYTVVPARNSPGVFDNAADNNQIVGNVFADCQNFRVYHPEFMDPINQNGPNGRASYISNRDDGSRIDDPRVRISNFSTFSLRDFTNASALNSAFPSPTIGSIASVGAKPYFFDGTNWKEMVLGPVLP